MTTAAQSFDVLGSLDAPASPVVLSVPHAGCDYPLALRAALRVPVEALVVLEDRHVDAVAHAARGGETLLVQRPARAWIDLNRAETERDPRLDEGASASGRPQNPHVGVACSLPRLSVPWRSLAASAPLRCHSAARAAARRR